MTAHDERIERGVRRGTDSGRRHVSVNVHHSINLDIDLREVLTRLELADVAWGERRSFPVNRSAGPAPSNANASPTPSPPASPTACTADTPTANASNSNTP